MEYPSIVNFVKLLLQRPNLSFFQGVKRPKFQHLGGEEITPLVFEEYLPNNIKGFTTMEKAMALEPIHMSATIENGVKLTYSLKTSAEVDWVKNGRILQVGLSYNGVNIKLYECTWGYAPNTNYENPQSVEQFKKALSLGNIHFGINAFIGITCLLEKINWAEILDPEDGEFPILPTNNIIKHSREAKPSQVIDLFIDDTTKVLHVNDVFSRIMNFGSNSIIVDIQNKPIETINFYSDYPLCKHFLISENIDKVNLEFQVNKNHKKFLKYNKELLLRIKNLKIDSHLYDKMKNQQLQELAKQFCIIHYKHRNISGAVLSNMMAYQLLLERIQNLENNVKFEVNDVYVEVPVANFIKHLNPQPLTLEQINFWRNTVGKSVGITSWYDPALEGEVFQIKEKENVTKS